MIPIQPLYHIFPYLLTTLNPQALNPKSWVQWFRGWEGSGAQLGIRLVGVLRGMKKMGTGILALWEVGFGNPKPLTRFWGIRVDVSCLRVWLYSFNLTDMDGWVSFRVVAWLCETAED